MVESNADLHLQITHYLKRSICILILHLCQTPIKMRYLTIHFHYLIYHTLMKVNNTM